MDWISMGRMKMSRSRASASLRIFTTSPSGKVTANGGVVGWYGCCS
jgi:hypothetical protein